jgi:hypothetical protein
MHRPFVFVCNLDKLQTTLFSIVVVRFGCQLPFSFGKATTVIWQHPPLLGHAVLVLHYGVSFRLGRHRICISVICCIIDGCITWSVSTDAPGKGAQNMHTYHVTPNSSSATMGSSQPWKENSSPVPRLVTKKSQNIESGRGRTGRKKYLGIRCQEWWPYFHANIAAMVDNGR